MIEAPSSGGQDFRSLEGFGSLHGTRRLADGVQPLNPIDRAMRCADLAIRGLGYPGLETQMLVWLDRRADAAALRTAIAKLSRCHPVIVSRLVEPGEESGERPYWRFRPEAVGSLEEAGLPSDGRDAVLDHAARLFSASRDLAQADPLRFHLLHRPSGRDVLLLQYNHVLMDNRAAALLASRIEALASGVEQVVNAPGTMETCPMRDPILDHLRRFSRRRRRAAAQRVVRLQGRELRGECATLRRDDSAAAARPAELRIAARTLSPERSLAFRSRVIALCGFPSLSMAILGSAFRAIDSLVPGRRVRGRQFVAGIGVALDARGPSQRFFQNLTSLVPIRAGCGELGDRDQLVRMLSAQMRQRLADDIDLGYLRLTALFSRRPRHVHWVVQYMLLYAYSLWYAYFGSQDSAGSHLCGAKIEDISYTGPVWGSTGLTLLASQYRGRLTMQATYDPSIVPPPLADEFLAFIETDLPC